MILMIGTTNTINGHVRRLVVEFGPHGNGMRSEVLECGNEPEWSKDTRMVNGQDCLPLIFVAPAEYKRFTQFGNGE